MGKKMKKKIINVNKGKWSFHHPMRVQLETMGVQEEKAKVL